MAFLNIKDPEAHRLAKALSARTGTSLTESVIRALQAQLEREQAPDSQADVVEEVKAILDRVAKLPVLDRRPADEILGYNRIGTFD